MSAGKKNMVTEMEVNNNKSKPVPTEKSVSVWGKVLSTSLQLPFVKVNREEFLNKELSKFCTPMEVMTALEEGPLGVLTKKEIDKLASSVSAIISPWCVAPQL